MNRNSRRSLKSGIVVVSAASFESNSLVRALRNKTAGRGITIERLVCGIGAITAAKNSPHIARRCRGKHVIFVGSCGAFGSFKGVEVIVATKAIWLPTCERLGYSYRVADTDRPFMLPTAPFGFQELIRGDIVCSPNISLTSRLPTPFNPDRCYENLELFSCAPAMSNGASSLTVVLAVTNKVGRQAHEQWLKYFKDGVKLVKESIVSELFPDSVVKRERT